MSHGHVVPNPDGSKARCGGPGICNECALEETAFIRNQIKENSMSHEDVNDYLNANYSRTEAVAKNPMDKFVGKLVVRTAPRITKEVAGFGMGGVVVERQDTSYMHHPIRVEDVGVDVAYYRAGPLGKLQILPAYYCDNNWEETKVVGPWAETSEGE